MAKFIIQGKRQLAGEIEVYGAKNAVLKTLPAALLMDGKSVIENVPDIEDVHRMVEIMRDLGATVMADGRRYTVDPAGLSGLVMPSQLHQKLRASILLAGPLLHRLGQITFPEPGGCVLGKRPVDFFLEGFEKFGVGIENYPDGYKLYIDKLKPAKIVFPRVSHTATEAMMTFATLIPGTTTLVNAAMEPEVVALAAFLNSAGAKISGAGTSVITIEGVKQLKASSTVTIPDRIEAGTFAIMAAASRSHIRITNINPSHLEVLWVLLSKAGIPFELGTDFVEMKPAGTIQPIAKDVVTHEYPGFPTDIQAPMTMLMTQAVGNSLIHETIYDGRLFYIDTLNSMGADILMCDPHRVLVQGVTPLVGKRITSPDIRAGITLVIAGLIAEGATELDNIYLIDRGYEKIEDRLGKLGARIERVS